MANSFKKTPVLPYTSAKSDKQGKIQAHRKFRTKMRNILSKIRGKEDVEEIEVKLPVNVREVSNVWDFPKDGKRYFTNLLNKYFRK